MGIELGQQVHLLERAQSSNLISWRTSLDRKLASVASHLGDSFIHIFEGIAN